MTGKLIVKFLIVVLCIGIHGAAPAARAQLDAGPKTSDKGISFGEAQVTKWRVGMSITAAGPCRGVLATVPVPTQWPEQTVRVLEEEISPAAHVTYRDLDGVRQMLIQVPGLPAGAEAHAYFTYEITRKAILAPPDPGVFVVPKRVPRDLRIFLGESPFIESRHAQIRSLAKEVVRDKETAWEQVEAIYDYVREKVEYREGELKGALAALRDGNGDCEELSSLVIALCRANKIPARTVWIPDHCYPEFYLEDDEGNGHWIPCQAAGTRAFGSMPEARPILQKGDNFRVPGNKAPQRYVAEQMTVKAVTGAGKPTVKFVREYVP